MVQGFIIKGEEDRAKASATCFPSTPALDRGIGAMVMHVANFITAAHTLIKVSLPSSQSAGPGASSHIPVIQHVPAKDIPLTSERFGRKGDESDTQTALGGSASPGIRLLPALQLRNMPVPLRPAKTRQRGIRLGQQHTEVVRSPFRYVV